jgi:hypothetical protein
VLLLLLLLPPAAAAVLLLLLLSLSTISAWLVVKTVKGIFEASSSRAAAGLEASSSSAIALVPAGVLPVAAVPEV